MAAPSNSEETSVYLRELLDPSVSWMSERLDGVYGIERSLQLNKCMKFQRHGSAIQFCLIASQGNEFVSTLITDPASDELVITTYRTAVDSMNEVWTSRLSLHSAANHSGLSSMRQSMVLHGYISRDGERMLVQYNLDYGDSTFYATSDRGTRWTQLKPKNVRYDSLGEVSDDDEHIFFRRSGGGFGHADQGEIIEAYSTKTWRSAQSWTFGYRNKTVQRNFSLLSSFSIDKPVFCAVDAGQVDDAEGKFCIICSSHGEQFHVKLDVFHAKDSLWVSQDKCHMVYLPEDDATVSYWDLTRPTFTPLFSADLLKVEKAQRYIHRINGKDTSIKHSIHKQVRFCRFSPNGEVVTIAVGNDCCIVINSFLTHNFQLVYQKIFNYELWPGWVVLHIDISEGRGVSVVGGTPNKGDSAGVFGLLVTFVEVPGAYAEIKKLEEYFDSIESNIGAIRNNAGVVPLHRWKISEQSLVHESGPTIPMTPLDEEYQQKLHESAFSGHRGALPLQTIHSRVTHLLTVGYPWNQAYKAMIFVVRMKYQYFIMAVGVTSIPGVQPYIVRVIHTSDNLYGHIPEQLEIFRINDHYILRVSGPNDGAYSGIQLPSSHITTLGHHFLRADSRYEFFMIKESAYVTMPSGWNITPNTAIVFTASFAAYFPPPLLGYGDTLDYGFRRKANYNMAKFLLWLKYTYRSRRNAPFFGEGELMNRLSEAYESIFDDRLHDEKEGSFASLLSAAADIDTLSHRTIFVDEFLRRYHRSDQLVIANTQSISCAMPALCRARPLGVLSLMRHFALFDFHIPADGGIEVANKAYEAKSLTLYRPRVKFFLILWEIGIMLGWVIRGIFSRRSSKRSGMANTKTVTIPLDGFCMHNHQLQGLPSLFRDSEASSIFYDLAASTYYKDTPKANLPLGLYATRPNPRTRLTSPFSSFVEEVLRLDDRGLQFAILKVIWFEKLVAWKMDTFAQFIYLQRLVMPLLLNVALQLALSILTVDGSKPIAALVLGAIQAAVLLYLIIVKIRQALGTTLSWRSIYNYFNIMAIALSVTMAVLVLSRNTPPRPFIAYSIPILWIDLILSSRVFEQAGTLMILLTEMTRGVLPFLCLLALFIIGFTFVPFFLLQAQNVPNDLVANPFSDYGRALGEMITFMSNDFNSLDPWKDEMVTIRILRAIFTILVSILLLNCLIALLNLKVEAAEQKSRNIWIRQMALLLVEIERGLLTDSERQSPHWFPRWFTYTLTESEKREWEDFVSGNPLHLGYYPDDDDKARNTSTSTVQPTASPRPTPKPAVVMASIRNEQSDSAIASTNQSGGTPATGQPTDTSPVPNAYSLVSSTSNQPALAQTPDTLPPSGDAKDMLSPGSNELPSKPKLVASRTQSTSQTLVDASPSTARPQLPGSSDVSSGGQPTSSSIGEITKFDAVPTTDQGSQQVDKCQICDQATIMVCSACKNARYCSAEHQLADWKNHKKFCKGKAKADDN